MCKNIMIIRITYNYKHMIMKMMIFKGIQILKKKINRNSQDLIKHKIKNFKEKNFKDLKIEILKERTNCL